MSTEAEVATAAAPVPSAKKQKRTGFPIRSIRHDDPSTLPILLSIACQRGDPKLAIGAVLLSLLRAAPQTTLGVNTARAASDVILTALGPIAAAGISRAGMARMMKKNNNNKTKNRKGLLDDLRNIWLHLPDKPAEIVFTDKSPTLESHLLFFRWVCAVIADVAKCPLQRDTSAHLYAHVAYAMLAPPAGQLSLRSLPSAPNEDPARPEDRCIRWSEWIRDKLVGASKTDARIAAFLDANNVTAEHLAERLIETLNLVADESNDLMDPGMLFEDVIGDRSASTDALEAQKREFSLCVRGALDIFVRTLLRQGYVDRRLIASCQMLIACQMAAAWNCKQPLTRRDSDLLEMLTVRYATRVMVYGGVQVVTAVAEAARKPEPPYKPAVNTLHHVSHIARPNFARIVPPQSAANDEQEEEEEEEEEEGDDADNDGLRRNKRKRDDALDPVSLNLVPIPKRKKKSANKAKNERSPPLLLQPWQLEEDNEDADVDDVSIDYFCAGTGSNVPVPDVPPSIFPFLIGKTIELGVTKAYEVCDEYAKRFDYTGLHDVANRGCAGFTLLRVNDASEIPTESAALSSAKAQGARWPDVRVLPYIATQAAVLVMAHARHRFNGAVVDALLDFPFDDLWLCIGSVREGDGSSRQAIKGNLIFSALGQFTRFLPVPTASVLAPCLVPLGLAISSSEGEQGEGEEEDEEEEENELVTRWLGNPKDNILLFAQRDTANKGLSAQDLALLTSADSGLPLFGAETSDPSILGSLDPRLTQYGVKLRKNQMPSNDPALPRPWAPDSMVARLATGSARAFAVVYQVCRAGQRDRATMGVAHCLFMLRALADLVSPSGQAPYNNEYAAALGSALAGAQGLLQEEKERAIAALAHRAIRGDTGEYRRRVTGPQQQQQQQQQYASGTITTTVRTATTKSAGKKKGAAHRKAGPPLSMQTFDDDESDVSADDGSGEDAEDALLPRPPPTTSSNPRPERGGDDDEDDDDDEEEDEEDNVVNVVPDDADDDDDGDDGDRDDGAGHGIRDDDKSHPNGAAVVVVQDSADKVAASPKKASSSTSSDRQVYVNMIAMALAHVLGLKSE